MSSWSSTKALRSVSVIGSVIGASDNAKSRLSGRFGRSRQVEPGCDAVLESAQSGPSPPQAGHQRADRNAERRRGFLVGQPLDSHDVKHGPLLLGQAEESLLDLG